MSELTLSRPKVLIIGAGPTGLMAASVLARFDVPIRIVDKSAGPAKESRAMVVQARSLELFQGLGLADAFLDAGVILTGGQLVVGGKPAAQIDFDDIGRVDTPFPFPLMIPQSETEAILLRDLEAQGTVVEYGVEMKDLQQDAESVTVTAAHGDGRHETIVADYVIGADGAHSSVRKALGLAFAGAAYEQNFLLADCRVRWDLPYGRLSIFLSGTEFAAYMPLRGSDFARIIVVAPGHNQKDASIDQQGSAEASLEEVETVFRRVAGHELALSDATWTSRYRVHHRGVDRYGSGRVFVAGDAAHIHSPAGGQGMNTGLQDAENLAWKLAAVLTGEAVPALLDSYHAERWPVGRKILDRTDKMFAGMTATNPLFAALRNSAIPVMGATAMRSETLRAAAFHFISELGIRYHIGPFVADALADGADTGGFRAGSRAPEGRISHARSVFDLLAPTRFTILALSVTPLDEDRIAEAAAGLAALPETIAGLHCTKHLVARSLIGRDPRCLQAEDADVFKSYRIDARMPQALMLVRPDGYIAYRADRLDFAGLNDFIRRYAAAPLEPI